MSASADATLCRPRLRRARALVCYRRERAFLHEPVAVILDEDVARVPARLFTSSSR